MRDRVLWIGSLVYALLFTWLGYVKYDVHRNLVDFGIFSQTVAAAFGCFCNTIEGSHWAFHFSPILYVAGLAVAIVHLPLTLIAMQAVAGALAAPPIYALVRARGTVVNARLAALVVWLYPPLAGLIFGDFHENGFAPAAIAWTIYFFDREMLGWAFGGALATLAIKEDQAIFLAIAGALGAWRYRGTGRGRLAGAVALLGLAVIVLFFGYIRPHAAAGAAAWQPERFYAWNSLGSNPAAQILQRVGFLLLIFVPLVFLPFRSEMMWLAAAPLAEVLLSRMPTTYTLGTHYAGAWIGYVLCAFAFGVRGLQAPRARTALVACIALCVAELAVADPLHPGINLRARQPRDAALDAFLKRLPPGANVATQEEAYAHLALWNPYATLLPESAARPIEACFALADWDFPDSARLQEYGPALRRLERERQYVAVERHGGLELFRRTGLCPASETTQTRVARGPRPRRSANRPRP